MTPGCADTLAGAIHYEIRHVSRYEYAFPARECVMVLCLKPIENAGQQLVRFEIETQPPGSLSAETDPFGNTRHVLCVHPEHESLEIAARSTVRPASFRPLPPDLGADAWKEIDAWRDAFLHWDYSHPSAMAFPSPALTDFTRKNDIARGNDPLRDLIQLADTLHSVFQYTPGSTSAASPIEEILRSGKGVCQDYAHVMIAVARSWGVPARYVSGYLYVSGSPGGRAWSNATHAWVECLLPELGWVGFDPTNRSLTDERHVRIATGRDYLDVSPTRGVRQGGGETRLEVDVRMRPLTDL